MWQGLIPFMFRLSTCRILESKYTNQPILLRSSYPRITRNMETIATLHRISREELSSLLLSSDSSKLAVVDVRDDDYIGGHIHNSINVPSSSLDYRGPEIVRKLADKEVVVFHCALSQQRGPAAALRYIRERDSKLKSQNTSSGLSGVQPNSASSEGERLEAENSKEIERADQGQEVDVKGYQDASAATDKTKGQKVYVLDGGFVKWQEKCVLFFIRRFHFRSLSRKPPPQTKIPSDRKSVV